MDQKSFVFRFGEHEVSERELRLTRAGETLALEPKALRVLLYLLHDPGRLVTKDELLNAVWGDTAVTENSLTRAVALLRKVLDDDIREPRFIATVPTAGYRFIAPVAVSANGNQAAAQSSVVATNGKDGYGANSLISSPDSSLKDVPIATLPAVSAAGRARFAAIRRWLTPAAIGCICMVGLAAWYLLRPLPPPHISDSVPITHDGHPKDLFGTDGSRLYLYYWFSGPQRIMQVATAGGEIAPFPVPLPNPRLQDVSHDGSSFLVSSEENGQQGLWDLQVPGGSVRRMANGAIVSAAWSPDARSLVYSTPDSDIFMVKSDGTDLRKLVAAEDHNREVAGDIAWSPDGAIIRFWRGDRLWEVSSDGSGLHQLLPGWRPSSRLACGRWTPDGKFFIFLEGNNKSPGGQLWALDERRTWARQTASDPVQLTSGPIRWGIPIPGRDGKKIFASAFILRGELVRYDAPTRELKPWLGGISAEQLSYSPDGKSIVYVSYPEGILWRANPDGTNPIQLTGPPFYPRRPRWSPDGSKILFFSDRDLSGGIYQSYIVSSQGGTPQPILPDEREGFFQIDPNWSPDGQKILFASGGGGRSQALRILDLASHQIVTLPGSQGIWLSRWSPDGRLIAGINQSGSCSIFDFDSRHWSELQKECSYPTFSSNSQFVYFIGGTLDGVFRVGVSGGRVERVVDLKGFHHVGTDGLWMGLDPTDTPILFRDRGSADIYALTLERK